ncbi:MAG: S1C family serine protease [Amoebophilaceae bacterium]|nr:S1C family serine protease [Amoebophilaceae bacterium]
MMNDLVKCYTNKIPDIKTYLGLKIFIISLYLQPIFAKEPFDPAIIAKAKQSVVTIAVTSSLSPYDQLHTWSGTGFIVDKKEGYILTNKHVIGTAVVGNYELTFYNGIQANAKVVYYDPWLDYGFLKVDPNDIPIGGVETLFSKVSPLPDEPVFIIGNNEGKSFSIHKGVVADVYHIVGDMPQQAILLSLNTTGGSSGSPVFNSKGEAIALNYSGNTIFANGLHPAYIRYALPFIKRGAIPIRKHIGVIVDSYALTDAVRYDGFPLAKQQAYHKKFPNASNRVIQVVTLLKNTPAFDLLLPGDILWAIDGKEIGPNLVDFDLAMSQIGAKNSVQLTLFRKGQWHLVTLPLYDLEAHKISKMVYFGGATFFESDDYFSKTGGQSPKTLTFALVEPQNIFEQVKRFTDGYTGSHSSCFRLKVLSFDGIPVANLDALVQLIPKLIEKRYFTMEYINAAPICTYNHRWVDFHIGYDPYKSNIAYHTHSAEPKLYELDLKHMKWIGKPIVK